MDQFFQQSIVVLLPQLLVYVCALALAISGWMRASSDARKERNLADEQKSLVIFWQMNCLSLRERQLELREEMVGLRNTIRELREQAIHPPVSIDTNAKRAKDKSPLAAYAEQFKPKTGSIDNE